ncbi:MAG TPA: sigma factor, partial [Chitinophagaceae bacterium]
MQTTDHTRLMSDEELIPRIISGETPLYEILIRRHNPVLYKIARSSGLNHQDAEDMMQEAHVSAFLELKNFGGRSSYKTWLSKIMLHKCYHKLHYGSLKFEMQKNELHTIKDNANQGISKNTTERTVINKELGLLLEQSL